MASNFAGGYIGYGKTFRGNVPGANDHAVSISYCNDITINGLETGIIQYPRSSGAALYLSTCNNIVIDKISVINSNINSSYCNGVTINQLDHCDRMVGYTNNVSGIYCVSLTASNDVTVANVSFGKNFTIPNCHPASGIMTTTGSNRVKLRKAGTQANPISVGTWATDIGGFARFFNTGGNNNTIRFGKKKQSTCETKTKQRQMILHSK